MPGPDYPAQDKAVEKLRTTALGSPGPQGKKAPPASAPQDSPSPSEAAWLLGLLALHGKGMPADPVQAQHWFERAYQLGYPLAPAGLAWCRIEGCGGTPNPALARTWIDRLHKVAPGRALFLEWYLENQLAPLEIARPAPLNKAQPPAPTVHRNLLLRAAQAGDSHALNELALENVASGRLDMALRQFQAAGRQSDAAAQNARLLAERMDHKATAPRTTDQAASDWFLQARRYHRGEGVPANYSEAIRLYQIAAASGSKDAKRMLELIYSRPAPQGAVDIAWMQQLAQLDITREGAVLAAHAPAGQPLFGRDPTPLYDLLPGHWRSTVQDRRH
jgi:TPR repeat protein